MKEIPKAYIPADFEDKIYADWERSGFFNPDKLPGKRKNVFSIVMPPPNVTGTLHVGHAAMLAIEDILTRFYRMRGYSALWLPGTDHAAIATQTKVEKLLKEKSQTRQSLGREKFLQEVEKFVAASKDTIHRQIRKMGSSCDWSREAYTLDGARTLAVRTMFQKMKDDGLIYRGDRVVNWCPRCASTLADDEVEYKEQDAKLYTFKYAKNFPFAISTTRPETKLGDTAAAVNPKDARYKKYIGKIFKIDFISAPLTIKIIADRGVDMKFGSGALGITPAHSFVDYEMAQKNNLPIIQVIGEDGKITDKGKKYRGLSVLEARKKIIEELKSRGLLEKEDNIKNNLSICYRCGAAVEPLPSKQWFVAVNKKITIHGNKYFKNKSLKEVAADAVKKGEIKIIPKRFEKIYYHWMDNLRDWCISRQIWFGHQIPGETDTFDTWFSSGMWTFSTLGWPKKAADLKKYHPTTVLETGYDILFFWVARMILMTTYAMGEVPFYNVYLHGLVRDEEGKKMSKSLGNAIDPLTVAEKYGTDAVRLSLVAGTSPGNDVKLSEEKIAGFRNFANKLWNISRYIVTASSKFSAKGGSASGGKVQSSKSLADEWIQAKFNLLITEVTQHLKKYEFSQAAERLREFTWNDFADWYLEISKIKSPLTPLFQRGEPHKPLPLEKGGGEGFSRSNLLSEILEKLLIMWHPFIPFVTEAIWGEMLGKKDLIVAEWPTPSRLPLDKGRKGGVNFEKIRELVARIRNLRAENKTEPGKIINLEIASKDEKLFSENLTIIEGLTKSKIQNLKSKIISPQIKILIDELDKEKNRERAKKELAEKEKYAENLKKKLENKEFVSRAPKAVVEGERAKLAKAEDEIKNLKEQLKSF